MTRSKRNLTTTRSRVFGDVECGTQCRICGRNVTDSRSKTCSDYCNNLLGAVMNLLNWTGVRRHIIERDDETCQQCGFDYRRERLARDHIKAIIDERVGERPTGPALDEAAEADDLEWDSFLERSKAWRERREELKEQYGDPYDHSRRLEVDHITPVTDGGHPFDPGNLQTLCSECHQEKTSRENSERAEQRTPSKGELSESLFEYISESEDAEPSMEASQ